MPIPVSSRFRKGGTLGTFAGAFTPSILTILGIILFQRLGYVVGAGGLLTALLIIALATSVSLLTSLSLAAIATNMRVRKGGDYYLISRTLGVHYGGAIGIVLFLAQAVSVAFYCIGFGEAVAGLVGQGGDPRVVAAIGALATIALGVLAYLGADWATRFQYVVMGALAVALVSFFWGAAGRFSTETLSNSWRPGESASGFWILFAILFPAVTGFTQGVSMSGDLKDPARSLPRGTFWAVAISTVIYLAAAIAFAGSLPLGDLAADYNAMRRIAALHWLIEVGVIAATLSSGMASFLGAPRILQSLAADNVFPILRPFARGVGPASNPRRAVLLSAAIALGTIALGSLNAIATVVGMCFLLSYGLLNYATFIEARANSPAFRPRFRFFNAWLCLAGSVLCLIIGIAISPIAAAIAGAIMVAIYQYLRRAAPDPAWSDSQYAHHFSRVRAHLHEMREGSQHPRDWRPHILALCNDPEIRARLLTFAAWIEGRSGFTTAVRLVLDPPISWSDARAQAEQQLQKEITDAGLSTFALAVTAPNLLEGFRLLVQAHGLGPLRPNTILMSAHEQLGEAALAGDEPPRDALDAALRQRQNVILFKATLEAWKTLVDTPPENRIIDVWWQDDDATSRLSLLLAHLTTRTPQWEDAVIRVHAIATDPAGATASREKLTAMLEEVRIDAEVDAVEVSGPPSVLEHSRSATLVFFPLRIRGRRVVGPLGAPLAPILQSMPVTGLVLAGADIDLAADPEDREPQAAEAPKPDPIVAAP